MYASKYSLDPLLSLGPIWLVSLPFAGKQDGYTFQKSTLAYLAKSYLFAPTSTCPTISSLCKHNAEVCEAEGLADLATIWLMLDDLAATTFSSSEEGNRRRSHSILSPRTPGTLCATR